MAKYLKISQHDGIRAATFLTVCALICAVPVGASVKQGAESDLPSDIFSGITTTEANGRYDLSGARVVAGLPDDKSSITDALGGSADQRVAESTLLAPKKAVEAAPVDSVPMTTIKQVHLRIWGFNEFSGNYKIDADTISIPGLGRLDVSKMSLSEFEAHVSASMSEAMRREVTVSAEVTEYLPYYITGHVRNSGETNWRPGLTVIQAVSLAGGEMRNSQQDGSGTSAANIVMQTEQTRTQLRFALTQLERLKAEKDSVVSFTPSSRLVDLANQTDTGVDSLQAKQNEILHQRRGMMETQLQSLQKEYEGAVSVLQSAETQAKAVQNQLDIAQEVLNGFKSLRDKKLLANTRYLEQQSELADAQVRVAQSQALVETSRARVATLEREMTMVRQERIATLADRIEALEREIAQHELTLATIGNTGASSAQAQVPMEYNIARSSPDGIETIPANVFTKVLPGDVVIVSPAADVTVETVGLSDRTQRRDTAEVQAIQRTQRLMANSVADRPALPAFLRSAAESAAGRR